MATVRRLVLTLLSFFLVTCCLGATIASAAPRDKAAQKKIEEAIYTHFLNTDFDAAEGLLLGTIRACEDKCSPAVVGKAWMYVGIIRGSGRNDIGGAQEAFTTAIAADPAVALDTEIATDPVKAAFAKVKGGGGAAKPAGPAGAITCTPQPSEIETRRPVPLQCESDKDLAQAKLFYKSFGSEWQSIKMEMHDGAYRATIPCAATQNTGKLNYYVQGLDGSGGVGAQLGSKEQPSQADVVSETTADPPAFPAEEPPARCGVETMGEAPPPSSGECGAWGAACGKDGCCEGELACIQGTCNEAQCESDSDCKDGGSCNSGRCEKDKSGPYAKNVIGLHFGADWTTLSSNGACTADASDNDHFTCRKDGTPVNPANLNSNYSGKVGGGFVLATLRLMASYERIFGPFSAEARLGFAFNGGTDFMPVHAEVRAKYWPLGEEAFSKPGFRPWVHVGGGFAQYDATVTTAVVDCSGVTSSEADKQNCLTTTNSKNAGSKSESYKVDATKRMGNAFVTAGGGVMYAIGKTHGVVANVNLTIPFGWTGFVIAPSIGYAVGF
jgi:hypothetical protein